MNLIPTLLSHFLGEIRKNNEHTGQVSYDCPACSIDNNKEGGDGKGNLEVNYLTGVFKCWVCYDYNNMSGRIDKLIKKYGNDRYLAEYKLLSEHLTPPEKKVLEEVTLPNEYISLLDDKDNSPKKNKALKYLLGRGITTEIIKKHDLGYCDHGKYNNRIIFPSYDANKTLNYFTSRWFGDYDVKQKYKNPTLDKNIIFNEHLINWDSTIYLVEGPTDHIVIYNSIPILGKSINEVLLNTLHERSSANIVILLDNDAIKDAISLGEKINFGNLSNRIYICRPKFDDPSKTNQLFGKSGIISMLKNTISLEKAKQIYKDDC